MTDETQNDVEETVEETEDVSATSEEETTEEEPVDESEELDNNDDDLPTTVEMDKYRKVLHESMARKQTIKDLKKELADLKASGTTDEAIKTENAELKNRLAELESVARKSRVKDALGEYMTAKKKAFVTPQAQEDLTIVIMTKVDPEWDDEDLEVKLPELFAAELKTRGHLVAKKKAPDLDESHNGKNTDIPQNLIDEIQNTYNV